MRSREMAHGAQLKWCADYVRVHHGASELLPCPTIDRFLVIHQPGALELSSSSRPTSREVTMAASNEPFYLRY